MSKKDSAHTNFLSQFSLLTDIETHLADHYRRTFFLIFLLWILGCAFSIYTRITEVLIFVSIMAGLAALWKTMEVMEIRNGECSIYEGSVVDYKSGNTMLKFLFSKKKKTTRTIIVIDVGNGFIEIRSTKNITAHKGDIVRLYTKEVNLYPLSENNFSCSSFYDCCVTESSYSKSM